MVVLWELKSAGMRVAYWAVSRVFLSVVLWVDKMAA